MTKGTFRLLSSRPSSKDRRPLKGEYKVRTLANAVRRRRSLSQSGTHPRRAGQSVHHTAGALYQAFPPAEARRLLHRLEFHYVPKHASWLNMVEIEIGVLRGQCLDRRIDSKKRLVSEIAAWERRRNTSRARIKWMFTTEKARTKMERAYPKPSTKES